MWESGSNTWAQAGAERTTTAAITLNEADPNHVVHKQEQMNGMVREGIEYASTPVLPEGSRTCRGFNV